MALKVGSLYLQDTCSNKGETAKAPLCPTTSSCWILSTWFRHKVDGAIPKYHLDAPLKTLAVLWILCPLKLNQNSLGTWSSDSFLLSHTKTYQMLESNEVNLVSWNINVIMEKNKTQTNVIRLLTKMFCLQMNPEETLVARTLDRTELQETTDTKLKVIRKFNNCVVTELHPRKRRSGPKI